MAVLGASGSGKTTLRNVIGGIESVNHGSIIGAGEGISGRHPRGLNEFRRMRAGFVFQFSKLIAGLAR
ncbi:ATP-binding cassette domain-containing protein [Nocardia pseudobrasiliensis]|uniref:ABC transporter family protein n=1 Tax=Nocardia pseudobrasiliensis TaxID=45979 RepID=A0A370I2S0_9NOCA|nr:ATP-binding cassette domain-containing protein [Nocardia pseudobrasiliensis]RDI65023.1 ABC transporter family protein [Nocardia pseudobrasiliensis]